MIRFLAAAMLGLAFAPVATPASATDCGEAIAHFRFLIDRDVKSGMLNQGVYDEATHELAGAQKDCAEGRNAAALSDLAAIKRRHGYH
jgi:hypothetical protein